MQGHDSFASENYLSRGLTALPVGRWLASGLLVGGLDFAVCSLFWATRGTPPSLIAESLAALVMGKTAFTAGAFAVALGLTIEATIGLLLVTGYALMASRHRNLLRRPYRYGAAYGALSFFVYKWIVVPLSASPPDTTGIDWQVTLLLIYMFILGVPSAILASRLVDRPG